MIKHEKIQPKGEIGDSGEKDAKEPQECPIECAVNEQIIGDVVEKSAAGAEQNVTERFADKPSEQPVKEKLIEQRCAITAPEVLHNENQLEKVSNEGQVQTKHAANQQEYGSKPEEYALVETTRDYIKFTPSVPPKEENEVFDTHPLETKPEEVLSESAPTETSVPIYYDAESGSKQSIQETELFTSHSLENKIENEVFDTHPIETKPEEVLSECAPAETNIPINYDAESHSEQSREENEVCDIHPIEEILFENAPTDTSVPINYDEKSSSEQSREENEVLVSHAFETKLEDILFEYAPVETSIPIDYDYERSKQSREENEVFTTHSLENKIEEVLFQYAPVETCVPINNCDAKSSRVENNVLNTSLLDINNELTDQEAIDVILIN